MCSNKNKYYTGGSIYIRQVKIERDGEQYGPFYQAVRSYREQGKVKQEVIHLGEHSTAESALESWPEEVKKLYRIGRPKQAEKLQRKLDKLRELTTTRTALRLFGNGATVVYVDNWTGVKGVGMPFSLQNSRFYKWSRGDSNP